MSDSEYTFPRSRRVTAPADFQAAYAQRTSVQVGPLMVHARPNTLLYTRLGLAIGKRAGNAAVRNRIKRMIRESFRLLQHELPTAYDLIVSARTHEPLSLSAYQNLLLDAARRLDGIWTRRVAKQPPHDPPPTPPSGE